MTAKASCALTTCVAFAATLAAMGAAFAADKSDAYTPGTRQGPFVVSPRTLSDLAKDGYQIRGNLGNALVLQKKASIYSCAIPPDPEHLSYRHYFVCSELSEERADGNVPTPKLPPLKMDEPHLKMDMPSH